MIMGNDNRSLSVAQVLDCLHRELPAVHGLAVIVGRWVWIEFDEKPAAEIRTYLVELGFRWNLRRRAWQHPCGEYCSKASPRDPRQKYGVRRVAAYADDAAVAS